MPEWRSNFYYKNCFLSLLIAALAACAAPSTRTAGAASRLKAFSLHYRQFPQVIPAGASDPTYRVDGSVAADPGVKAGLTVIRLGYFGNPNGSMPEHSFVESATVTLERLPGEFRLEFPSPNAPTIIIVDCENCAPLCIQIPENSTRDYHLGELRVETGRSISGRIMNDTADSQRLFSRARVVENTWIDRSNSTPTLLDLFLIREAVIKREARIDSDGTFSIRGLPSETVQVVIHIPGLLQYTVNNVNISATADTKLEKIVLHKGSIIIGKIEGECDPNGEYCVYCECMDAAQLSRLDRVRKRVDVVDSTFCLTDLPVGQYRVCLINKYSNGRGCSYGSPSSNIVQIEKQGSVYYTSIKK